MSEPTPDDRAPIPGWLRELALGFVFWLVLVLVLEPGNLIASGGALPLGREVLRLTGAGLLGAAITPVVFALTKRFPVEGEARWRYGAIHLAVDAVIAVGLIVVAGVLARLAGIDKRPLAAALLHQLAVDGALLFFAVAALTAIAHAALFYRRAQNAMMPPAVPATGYLIFVPVKARRQVTMLDLAQVGWIESQGNYLALHAGASVHLIRETSAKFEAGLDPARFVRIHRQSIVALNTIKAITAQASGDATVTLTDGTQLRMSRGFREAVRTKFEAQKS